MTREGANIWKGDYDQTASFRKGVLPLPLSLPPFSQENVSNLRAALGVAWRWVLDWQVWISVQVRGLSVVGSWAVRKDTISSVLIQGGICCSKHLHQWANFQNILKYLIVWNRWICALTGRVTHASCSITLKKKKCPWSKALIISECSRLIRTAVLAVLLIISDHLLVFLFFLFLAQN